MKKLIIFDLDGTLARSKSAIDAEMAELFYHVLHVAKIAIISGGDWPQFEKQVLQHLPKKTPLDKLVILPTCGTKYYNHTSGWKKRYSEDFSEDEKTKIITNLHKAIDASGCSPDKIWGELIEDRGSQITYSGLGQQAPLEAKKNWDADFKKRKKIKERLQVTLPEFSVHVGGATSIDITKTGIDKAYGIQKLREVLSLPISEMIFIGDALFEGGNDNPARSTGVDCIQVRDPEETKRLMEALIACLKKTE
ncbi:hypothetical protein LCGC14_1416730 [marine sediment metagenome]|uniref:phosphomannomutase n=2 Tax=root TaxID=1 RepID=A0A831VRU0_9FLAO|nr:HAD-IIB family hydrolase [Pricia antarctica]